MKYIYTEQELNKAIEEIISTLIQELPYDNDRDDIFTALWIDYYVTLPFKQVYSKKKKKIIEITDKKLNI